MEIFEKIIMFVLAGTLILSFIWLIAIVVSCIKDVYDDCFKKREE